MKATCFILIVIITFAQGIVHAQLPAIDSLVSVGIEYSINQKYAAAESLFEKIINMDPTHPRGYFFKAATIQSKSMDYETNLWEGSFLSYLEKTEELSKERIKRNEKDVWAHFFLGSALSYRAFFEGRKKKYVPAISHGLAGIASLNRVIELDSTIYDAYFGIGSYKYWRSKITRYLNWLPLLEDEREAGIRMVTLAAKKGKYTNYAAINGLVWILIDHGQVSEALIWAKKGVHFFPESRFFLWGMAKSYYNLQHFEIALIYYEMILNSIQQETFNNHYNEVICYYKIAQCYFHLKQYQKASQYYDAIFSIPLKGATKERLQEILKKAKELKNEINKANHKG